MKNNKMLVTAYSLLPITIGLSAASVALAEEELKEIVVEDAITQQGATQLQIVHKSHKTIQQEMIRDTRDLVRYTTDVGISDNGRHLKGFAMRGVEGNRVGISVDGVSIPDFEENSLYSRYGNFNSSRLTVDPELVRGINVVRGSDSFNSGSGYLGGGVNYHTLDAVDLVRPENKFGGLVRSGYSSKNREWIYTTGVGYKDDKWEAVLLYSQRRGHELKSNGHGKDVDGGSRGIPDPSKHTNQSYLAKLSYLFNDSHRVSVSFNGQRNKNYTNEKSYNLSESAWRETQDLGRRQTLNFAYEYFPTSGFLGYLRADYDHQKTDVGAINYKGLKVRDYTVFPFSFTGARDLDEIYDRRMKTTFNRIFLRLDSNQLNSGFGDHTLSFRTGFSRNDFKNINIDSINITSNAKVGDPPDVDIYAIQRPVRTNHLSFSLLDTIVWNDIFGSELGLRYDRYQLNPQELNARCRNCNENVDSARFNGLSGIVGVNSKLNEIWKLSYTLSTGFRVPNASEMYFTYTHPAGNWLANPNLKSERSLTHNLSLQGSNNLGNLGVNVYHTRYKNFLYEQTTVSSFTGRETLYTQMVNKDNARISGIEINGHLNLHEVAPFIPNGFKFMGGLGYSKGKVSGDTSLLSIQPLKAIIGLDYEDPDGRWGIFSRLTYLGGKKAKDAKVLKDDYRCRGVERPNPNYDPNDYWSFEQPTICDAGRGIVLDTIDFPYLNKPATIFDLFGYYNLTKEITFRAGVYNLFNRRYHTWDALRGIPVISSSTTNTVDAQGKGLERFYAPGRNYSASLEIRF